MIRVGIITRNFPPLKGGMERLNEQIFNLLNSDFDCQLFGPAGCEDFAPENRARGSRVSPTPIFLLLSFIRGFVFYLLNPHPQVIIGGSGLVAPVVLALSKLFRTRSVIMIHGLDIIVESRLYRWLFLPCIRRVDLVVSNSENTKRLAVSYGINENRITIIPPGVEKPKSVIDKTVAKNRYEAEGIPVLLSVGRLIPRKGLPEFIREALPSIVKANPTTEFWIAGTEPGSALNKNTYSVLEKIEAAIEETGLSANVKLLGRVDDEELCSLYAAADVFIFPLVETPGDVEGFGMVAIEAGVYGTPTVAFNCGGVSDAISHGASGYLVEPTDYTGFVDAVHLATQKLKSESVIDFANNFSWDCYGPKLHEEINALVSSR